MIYRLFRRGIGQRKGGFLYVLCLNRETGETLAKQRSILSICQGGKLGGTLVCNTVIKRAGALIFSCGLCRTSSFLAIRWSFR